MCCKDRVSARIAEIGVETRMLWEKELPGVRLKETKG